MEYKTCIVCGGPLKGRQTRFCSEDCLKKFKREQTHLKRPLRDHVCQCRICEREMRIGRPRVGETHPAPAFAQPALESSLGSQAAEPSKPKAQPKEVCEGSEQTE